MDQIDLTRFDDEGGFTVQFIGPPGLIAVDTLVETLSGFSEALEVIGDIVDPAFELQVYVDSVAPGSVKIGVKLKKRLKKLDSLAVAGTVVVGLFSNYLYDQIKADEKCNVVMTADKVTVQGDHCNLTINRQVYELAPKVEHNPKVAHGVKRALQAVKRDEAVRGVGVSRTPDAKPEVFIERVRFDDAIKRLTARAAFDYVTDQMASIPAIVHETRTQTIRTNLVILKAWLERGRRKWRSNWQGLKISASIKDPDFFDQLAARSLPCTRGP